MSFFSDLIQSEILPGLKHHLSITRNEYTDKLIALLYENNSEECFKIAFETVFSLCDCASTWEARQQGFVLAKALLISHYKNLSEEFTTKLLPLVRLFINDSESRVRIALANFLQELCRLQGVSVYLELRDYVISNIENQLERNVDPNADDAPVFAAQGMMHDTEGWKSLETSFQALHRMMAGCGEAFAPYITPDLLALIFRTGTHTNRFVREVGYFTCGVVAEVCENSTLNNIADELTNILGRGLADNWSQVRFAASVASRQFLLKAVSLRDTYYSRLIPAMVLNRYYMAPGVNKYSQETWVMVTGTSGRELVAKYIDELVSFLILQSEAENHAVREASCLCFAEIATKIDHKAAAPHVPRMLTALLDCFKDPSWPVRDSACVACGEFVVQYPQESLPILDSLFSLWFAHISDNIPSVRVNNAKSLGKCMKAYGEMALTKVLEFLRMELPMAKKQPAESKKYSNISNVTTFGVAHKKMRDNDPELHTGGEVYTCGSMRSSHQDAPDHDPTKLVHGQAALVRRTGCMDHGFAREKEPWEQTDGAVFLLTEVSAYSPQSVAEFMPTIADVADINYFGHHWHLKESIWKQIPLIAHNIGKRPFKSFLEDLLPPLFRALVCDNRLAQNAAGEALGEIGKFIGNTILKGRLSPEQIEICRTSEFVEPPLGNAQGKSSFIYEELSGPSPLFPASSIRPPQIK